MSPAIGVQFKEGFYSPSIPGFTFLKVRSIFFIEASSNLITTIMEFKKCENPPGLREREFIFLSSVGNDLLVTPSICLVIADWLGRPCARETAKVNSSWTILQRFNEKKR